VLDAAAVAKAPVVGYSIGGGIALEMALTMPGRVSSLVLLSPVLPDREYEPEFFASLREVARATRRDGIRAAMLGPWLESPLWRGSIAIPGVRERLAELVADFPGAECCCRARPLERARRRRPPAELRFRPGGGRRAPSCRLQAWAA
jgi:pimeloyl-ACP methyl ester carboxylesterase